MTQTTDILQSIEQHQLWVNSSGTSGRQMVVEDLNVENMSLDGPNFALAELPGLRFVRCHLTALDFHGANLAPAEFENCVIERCIFTKANLDYALFTGGRLALIILWSKTLQAALVSGAYFLKNNVLCKRSKL